MNDILRAHPGLFLPFLAAAVAEFLWRTRFAGRGYDARAALASIAVAAGGIVARPVMVLLVLPLFDAVAALAPRHWPADDWRWWMAGFFAVEFAYYWFHRWSHTVHWLWATHATHHSANEMVLPAAIRLGWTTPLSGGWLLYLPLALLGMPPAMVFTLLAANLLYQYGLHTEAVGRLGPLEWLFNTPSHHRAHHASDAGFIDCNFGGVLIVFDRLFGSFRAEPIGGGLRYGLVDPIRSHSPVVIALRQWRVLACGFCAATDTRGRWQALFGRPPAHGPTPAAVSPR